MMQILFQSLLLTYSIILFLCKHSLNNQLSWLNSHLVMHQFTPEMCCKSNQWQLPDRIENQLESELQV